MKKSEFIKFINQDIDRLQKLYDEQKEACREAGINAANPFIIGVGSRLETLRQLVIEIEKIDELG